MTSSLLEVTGQLPSPTGQGSQMAEELLKKLRVPVPKACPGAVTLAALHLLVLFIGASLPCA